MRISDCSSDGALPIYEVSGGGRTSTDRTSKLLGDHRSSWNLGGQFLLETAKRSKRGLQLHNMWWTWQQNLLKTARLMSSSAMIDRTSVVKGKSVSVRVDLGGRRIIKKKKKKKT